MTRSKGYTTIKSKLDKNKSYTFDEGIKFIKENPNAKFDESIELHLKLGIDVKKSEQQVKGNITLPHNVGKEAKIIAFVGPDKLKEAKEAGAAIVGGEELINEIKDSKKINFDVAVAEPKIMPKLAQIAKILGPKGLMPSPKTETVGENIKEMIALLKKGKLNFKNDDSGNIHQVIGKLSWDQNKLKENYESFTEVIRRSKPASAKGIFIRSITLCSTMGPAVKVTV